MKVNNIAKKVICFTDVAMVQASVMAGNVMNVFASNSGSGSGSSSGNTSGGTDLFTAGTSAAKTLYKDIVKISTPIAVVAIVATLLFAMFNKSQKAMDESRSIAKGIGISWLVINGLGFILTYVQSLIGANGMVTL